jgi:hypothetical protein
MDQTTESDLSKSFIRQRRNLIGISIILLFFQSSKIVISTINILGNTFNINDPTRVSYVLWFAWIYLLVRYYQFYRYASSDGTFNSAIESRISVYVPAIALAKYKKTYEPDKVAPNIPLPHKIFMHEPEIITKQWNEWRIQAHVYISDSDEKQHVGSDSAGEVIVILERNDLLKMRLKAYIHVAIHTPFSTEYHLPFVIAVVPVVYFFFDRVARQTPTLVHF